MSVKVTWAVGQTPTLEFEATGQKDLVEQLAMFGEVLSESKCGACSKANLKYQVRTVEDNKYYEIKCQDCGAVLAFGQHKKGETLFPKRKDSEGNYLKNQGWVKWEGPKDN